MEPGTDDLRQLRHVKAADGETAILITRDHQLAGDLKLFELPIWTARLIFVFVEVVAEGVQLEAGISAVCSCRLRRRPKCGDMSGPIDLLHDGSFLMERDHRQRARCDQPGKVDRLL